MNFVMSTLTNSVDYTFYSDRAGIATAIRTIRIKGGSYRRDPKTLQVGDGVVSEVTDEQLEMLRTHPLFIQHEKNSEHIVVKAKRDVSKAKKDGADPDGSSQLTEEDYKKEGKEPPKTVAQANEDDDSVEE